MNNITTQKQAEQFAKALLNSISLDKVVILPSTTRSSHDTEESHMKALEFHKTYGKLKELAAEYDLGVKLYNLEPENGNQDL